ncbi:hypothetical protein KCP78_10555 [Salmonella enterica subsp. enterica]|nr:hypothetical protein KCP78_10555 [Salmonella enterica subsp. enterica]
MSYEGILPDLVFREGRGGGAGHHGRTTTSRREVLAKHGEHTPPEWKGDAGKPPPPHGALIRTPHHDA